MKKTLTVYVPEIQRFEVYHQKDTSLPCQINFVTKKVGHDFKINKSTDIDSLRLAMQKFSIEHAKNLRHFKSL